MCTCEQHTYTSSEHFHLACVAGAKRGGRGGGEKCKRGEREGSFPSTFPSAPYGPPFFPFSLSPIPFDACYAG